MAHEIWITRAKKGSLEVQPWNLRLGKDPEVKWVNKLVKKEVVTVFFPNPSGIKHITETLGDSRTSKVYDFGRKGLKLPRGEYPYAVHVDEGAGHRSLVHHNDPKIILW